MSLSESQGQGRRRVFKKVVRPLNAIGVHRVPKTRVGESTREGLTPSRKGVWGNSPEKIFKLKKKLKGLTYALSRTNNAKKVFQQTQPHPSLFLLFRCLAYTRLTSYNLCLLRCYLFCLYFQMYDYVRVYNFPIVMTVHGGNMGHV